jgi:hypothetical protein
MAAKDKDMAEALKKNKVWDMPRSLACLYGIYDLFMHTCMKCTLHAT